MQNSGKEKLNMFGLPNFSLVKLLLQRPIGTRHEIGNNDICSGVFFGPFIVSKCGGLKQFNFAHKFGSSSDKIMI